MAEREFVEQTDTYGLQAGIALTEPSRRTHVRLIKGSVWINR